MFWFDHITASTIFKFTRFTNSWKIHLANTPKLPLITAEKVYIMGSRLSKLIESIIKERISKSGQIQCTIKESI